MTECDFCSICGTLGEIVRSKDVGRKTYNGCRECIENPNPYNVVDEQAADVLREAQSTPAPTNPIFDVEPVKLKAQESKPVVDVDYRTRATNLFLMAFVLGECTLFIALFLLASFIALFAKAIP